MRLVYGFGVNDADYVVKPMVNGKRVACPAYDAWKNMLARCYSKKCHSMWPTYIGVSVCEEWRSFMAFREWWLNNHIDGWQLDKDLLGDGRKYSPSTCMYVPSWINSFNNNCGSARGDLPIGVNYHKQSGKYQARCSHPFGKHEQLGLFDDKYEAGSAWLNRKLEIAAELKSMMDDIDARIYGLVVGIILKAK